MKSGVAGTIPTDLGDAFGSVVHPGSTGCCTIARPSDEQAVTTAQSGTRRPGRHERRRGYTIGMKTAISLPDAVFHAAERQAKRAQKSRSQLYAEALAEYLDRHAPDEVTAAMNQVVDQLDATPDAFVRAAAQSVLARVEW